MDSPFRVRGIAVDPRSNEVLRDSGITRVNPKAMQVLARLAETPGEVVTKEELLRSVWPDSYVGEEVLTTAIYELRKVLGDDARDPGFIQTIHRIGYRLLVEVEALSVSGFFEESAPAGPNWIRWSTLAATGVLALTVMAAKECLRTEVVTEVVKSPVVVERVGPESRQARDLELDVSNFIDATGLFDRFRSADGVSGGLTLHIVATSSGLRVEAQSSDGVLRKVAEAEEYPPPGSDPLPCPDTGDCQRTIQLRSKIRDGLMALLRPYLEESKVLSEAEVDEFMESHSINPRAWKFGREADEALADNRYSDAEALVEKARELDPEDVGALEVLAHRAQVLGEVRRAEDAGRVALEVARRRGVSEAGLLDLVWRQASILDRWELVGGVLRAVEAHGVEGPNWARRRAWYEDVVARDCDQALALARRSLDDGSADPKGMLNASDAALTCGLTEDRAGDRGPSWWADQAARLDQDGSSSLNIADQRAYIGILRGDRNVDRVLDELAVDALRDEAGRARWNRRKGEVHLRGLRCGAARNAWSNVLASELPLERRRTIGHEIQRWYECGLGIDEDRVRRWEAIYGETTSIPWRGYAFLVLLSFRLDERDVDASRRLERALSFRHGMIRGGEGRQGGCDLDSTGPVVRVDEEWPCLADAEIAFQQQEYRRAERIHRHIETKVKPHDRALFRFHHARTLERWGIALQRYGDRSEVEAKLDEADDAYRSALAFNPNHVPSLCGRAFLLMRRGHWDSAQAAGRSCAEARRDADE